MDKIKRIIPVISFLSLFIIVFNVLAFILAKELNANFWCGYIVITLSWISLLVVAVLTTSKNDAGKSVFLNAPGLLLSLVHLLIQVIIGVSVMVISFFSVKATVCFEIVIFAIYLGIIGALEFYKRKSI